MHEYANNTADKDKIHGHLTVAAIMIAIAFNYLIRVLKIPIPWYIDTPAVAGFYGSIYWLFDNFLWRWRIRSISPFTKIPDIRGTWVGKVQSSYQNTEVEVVVHVRQTWSKISIELESVSSKSFTIMAALNIDAGHDSGLKYEYRNVAKQYGKTPEHIGTGHLNISPDCKKLEGRYYTSEGSNNTGTIVLHLLDKSIIPYEEALKQARQKHLP